MCVPVIGFWRLDVALVEPAGWVGEAPLSFFFIPSFTFLVPVIVEQFPLWAANGSALSSRERGKTRMWGGTKERNE